MSEKRIGELLDANNREVERRREVEQRLRRALDEAALARADALELLTALRRLYAASVAHDGSWGEAMSRAYTVLRKYEAVGLDPQKLADVLALTPMPDGHRLADKLDRTSLINLALEITEGGALTGGRIGVPPYADVALQPTAGAAGLVRQLRKGTCISDPPGDYGAIARAMQAAADLIEQAWKLARSRRWALVQSVLDQAMAEGAGR